MVDPNYEYKKAFLQETLSKEYSPSVQKAIEGQFTRLARLLTLVNMNGELPAGDEGDTLIVSGDEWVAVSSRVPFTNLIQNLGIAVAGHFDISGLSGLTADANVHIFQSAQQVPSKGNARDEFEMDPVVATGYVVDESTVRVYWSSVNGSVIVGDVAFAYHVGR